MKVKFWGVRGSIPSPSHAADSGWKLEKILEFARQSPLISEGRVDDFMRGLPFHLLNPVGGNTPCVEVTSGHDRVILDGGSGLRKLGLELSRPEKFDEHDLYVAIETGLDPQNLSQTQAQPGGLDLTLLFSHTHWDHIQGFPFFTPAYVSGNRLSLYGLDGGKLAEALDTQQRAPDLFPIPLSGLAAELRFHTFPAEGLKVGNLEISALKLPHPGGSLAYRLTAGGRSVIYATDYEFPYLYEEQLNEFSRFIEDADLLITDTQYTYLESVAREGWGHYTSFAAVDLAIAAGVRSLLMFHHDPEHNDAKLLDNLDKTRAYHALMGEGASMTIDLAVEGLVVEV